MGTRRRFAVAALVCVSAVLLPSAATTATPELTVKEVRLKLAEAITLEKRAIALLKKTPPRTQAAVVQLERSRERLSEIRSSARLSKQVSQDISIAEIRDGGVITNVRGDPRHTYSTSYQILLIEHGLERKDVAMSLLAQPATAQGSQCGDRLDNDGDGTVDARHDSGCSSAKDTTEGSPLTCSLGYTAGTVAVVRGTCSGPVGTLQLDAPAGAAFDVRTPAVVPQADACHYVTPRRLECSMSDGVENPRHVLSARFRLAGTSQAEPRVLVRDFRRRGRSFRARRAAAAGGYLRFRLSYTHTGRSHVCASIVADSGARLQVKLEGPNGLVLEGTLQLKKKETKTAPGSFSFGINEFGTHRVTIVSTANGKTVTRTQTIEVTGAPGDPRCSATGAAPP